MHVLYKVVGKHGPSTVKATYQANVCRTRLTKQLDETKLAISGSHSSLLVPKDFTPAHRAATKKYKMSRCLLCVCADGKLFESNSPPARCYKQQQQ